MIPVPVNAVNFSRPTSTVVTVTQNIPMELQCTTSTERPRSTVQWYISGNPVPLGTGTNTPTDNDTLTSTTSKLRLSFNRTSDGQQLFCTAFNVDGQTPIVSSRKNLVVECKEMFMIIFPFPMAVRSLFVFKGFFSESFEKQFQNTQK